MVDAGRGGGKGSRMFLSERVLLCKEKKSFPVVGVGVYGGLRRVMSEVYVKTQKQSFFLEVDICGIAPTVII